MSKKKPVSAKEIHKRAEDALRNDKNFEYECVHDGALCVWNPYLEYVVLISVDEAILMEKAFPEEFYPVIHRDEKTGEESEFSDYYEYYWSDTEEQSFAVCMKRRDG